jgi:hypothetical protein
VVGISRYPIENETLLFLLFIYFFLFLVSYKNPLLTYILEMAT